jgi:hypothetical protein
MPDTYKKCQICHQFVPSTAKVCMYCGKNFGKKGGSRQKQIGIGIAASSCLCIEFTVVAAIFVPPPERTDSIFTPDGRGYAATFPARTPTALVVMAVQPHESTTEQHPAYTPTPGPLSSNIEPVTPTPLAQLPTPILNIVARKEARAWSRLAGVVWIAAFLVDGTSESLSVAEALGPDALYCTIDALAGGSPFLPRTSRTYPGRREREQFCRP